MSKERIGAYVVIAFFSAITLYWPWRQSNRMNEIKCNQAIAVGYVYDVVDVGSKYPGGTVFYHFNVDNVQYDKSDQYTKLIKGNKAAFVGCSFSVLYSKENYRNSKILINHDDFRKFEIAFPDSIRWVEDYFN